jgi:hypothetical protein
VLNEELMSSLQTKYEELVATEENLVEFFEFFLYSMLNHIDQMQHVFSMYATHNSAIWFAKTTRSWKQQSRSRRRRSANIYASSSNSRSIWTVSRKRWRSRSAK